MAGKSHPVTVRLDDQQVARIFAIKERYPQVYPKRMARGRYNRSTILNMVIDRGLAVVEAELEAGGWTDDD